MKNSKIIWLLGVAVFLICKQGLADQVTVGPNGIDSLNLGLDGTGVSVGQVDDFRPPKPFFDPNLFALSVEPEEVFARALPAVPDELLSLHALGVASVIISKNFLAPGVAQQADLFSSAALTSQPGGPQEAAAEAANHLATINGGAVRAIDHSYVLAQSPSYPGDGSALLSLFIDWSAQEQDVLHVFGTDESSAAQGLGSVPNDSFNGIGIGASSQVNGQGAFRRVSAFNTPAVLPGRSNIDLIAPGDDVVVISFDDFTRIADGTSFAAR